VRLVSDTNVLLSGLLWHGAPHRLIEAVRTGEVALVSSPVLLAELEDVVGRAKFAAIFTRIGREPHVVLDEVRRMVEIVVAPSLPQPVCRDPDDDAVLALAIAAEADLVVSGDADLLVLGQFRGISIVTAAQAVERLVKA
jgi:putative PIN family toxin of toxin-antitoxin system